MSRGAAPRGLVAVLTCLLLGALLALALRASLLDTITDWDELWHLATGRWIAEHGAVPRRDPFTWTAGETPWTNTNWLAQLLLWALYRRGGLELDWLLGQALLMQTVALVHVRVRSHVRSAWAAAPFTFVVFLVLWTGSTVRPQGWTFLLLAATLLLVDRLRARRSRIATAVLGFTLALAGQLHGGFVFLFGAVGLVALGEGWDLARRAPGASRSFVGALLGALVVGTASFALHPHGAHALLHPLRYALDPRVRAIFPLTAELAPPDLTQGAGKWTELWTLGLLGLALVGRPRLRTADVVLALAFLKLALESARGLHALAIVAAAPGALALESALEAARETPLRNLVRALSHLEPAARAFERQAPVALALALAITVGVRWPRYKAGEPGDLSSPLLAPAVREAGDAAAFLEAHAIPGRLWNELETGGALAWRGHPAFIDGRGDLHALAGTWPDLCEVMARAPGWEKVLDRRQVDVVLIRRERPQVQDLERLGWRVLWSAPGTALLGRPPSGGSAAAPPGR